MDEPKRHRCSGDLPYHPQSYGAALTKCYEDKLGCLYVDNGEYSTQVNYCPYCGYKAPQQVSAQPG